MTRKQDILQNRPLSPHLTVYKLQISTALSIFHRGTGIALYFSLMIFSWLMITYILGGESECTECVIGSKLFCPAIFLISYAAIYHTHTGIRHLFWDIGYGFSRKAVDISGIFIILSSLICTMIFWYFLI